MDLYCWKPEYSVKIKVLDEHHQHLFELVNELHDFMRMGKGDEIMITTLRDLLLYTRNHFAAEEVLMTTFSYPQFLSHRLEHQKLTRSVHDFITAFEAGERRFSPQLMDFLNDWLTCHILQTDLQYTAFLRERGAV